MSCVQLSTKQWHKLYASRRLTFYLSDREPTVENKNQYVYFPQVKEVDIISPSSVLEGRIKGYPRWEAVEKRLNVAFYFAVAAIGDDSIWWQSIGKRITLKNEDFGIDFDISIDRVGGNISPTLFNDDVKMLQSSLKFIDGAKWTAYLAKTGRRGRYIKIPETTQNIECIIDDYTIRLKEPKLVWKLDSDYKSIKMVVALNDNQLFYYDRAFNVKHMESIEFVPSDEGVILDFTMIGAVR